MRFLHISIFFILSLPSICQERLDTHQPNSQRRLHFGLQGGAGWTYEDKAHLFNTTACFTIDYHIKKNYYFQFAPRYSWLWKWNEHYLSLPLHLRKKFRSGISLFAGPAMTFDLGYFKDLGISTGAYFQITERSALVISTYTFTLNDYNIDYFYAPVSIAYSVEIH